MNKDEKKVVNVSTKKEVVVQKPKVENFDVSKSLEEHMEENKAKVKTKIDYKTIFMYVIMVIIVVACVLLLVHFCESSMADLNKKTTTNLNYQLIKPTTKETNSVEYVIPSTVPTAATHTVFVGNKTNNAGSNDPVRTNYVPRKTTKKSTTATTTTITTTTTTTEETTNSTTTTTTTTKAENSEETTGDN